MTEIKNIHENFLRRDEIKAGSNRVFGIVFGVVFLIMGSVPIISGAEPRIWALCVCTIFFIAALSFPNALKPLNMIWFRLGMFLHTIVNPLIMGLLFFMTVVPIGLIMRLMGKDLLNLQFDPDVSSYWIERDSGEPRPETMRHQF